MNENEVQQLKALGVPEADVETLKASGLGLFGAIALLKEATALAKRARDEGFSLGLLEDGFALIKKLLGEAVMPQTLPK